MPRQAPRIQSFEWARALAALAIVVLHVIRATELSAATYGAAPALIDAEALAFFPFARWAVPVFFMMSGALMLDPARPMPPAKVARHVWRIAFALLTFGLAFCLMESAYAAGMTLSVAVVREALLNLLAGRSWDHLWYLYATLGLYVATPALRWVNARLGGRQRVALLLLFWGLCCVLPTLALYGSAPELTVLAGGCGWAFSVVYYYAGAVVYPWAASLGAGPGADGASGFRALPRAWKALVALGGLALLAMAAATVGGEGILQLPEYALALPFGVAVFLLIVRYLEKPLAAHGPLRLLATYSFGIYVVHPLFSHLVLELGPLALAAAAAGPLGVALLQLGLVVLGVLGSVAVARAVRHLPGFAGKI